MKLSETKNNIYYDSFLYIMMTFGAIFCLLYKFKYNANMACLTMGITTLLALIYKFSAKKIYRTIITAHVYIFITIFTISSTALFTNGINSTTIWWLSIVPIIATFFLNNKQCFVWSFITILTIICITYLSKNGYVINEMQSINKERLITISLSALIIATTGISFTYDRLTKKLKNHNKKIRYEIEIEKLNNAYQKGINKNSQEIIHLFGNLVTPLDFSIRNDKQIKKMNILKKYIKKLEIPSKENDKIFKFIDAIIDEAQEKRVFEMTQSEKIQKIISKQENSNNLLKEQEYSSLIEIIEVIKKNKEAELRNIDFSLNYKDDEYLLNIDSLDLFNIFNSIIEQSILIQKQNMLAKKVDIFIEKNNTNINIIIENHVDESNKQRTNFSMINKKEASKLHLISNLIIAKKGSINYFDKKVKEVININLPSNLQSNHL